MGDINSYEHFGLREMLFAEVPRNGMKTHIPAQCRYSAKDASLQNGGEPSKTIKVISIPYLGLKKALPPHQLNELLSKFGVDPHVQKEGLVQVNAPNESTYKGHTKNIMSDEYRR